MTKRENPIIYSDFPDPDIIRVENTYYMVSTTMHFMPGCDILRSYDLCNWEFVCHAFDYLEKTDRECLVDEKNAYGNGMWAPSFRYHNGQFYISFTANDLNKTFLLSSPTPIGPWKMRNIEGFYHDNSLFFDDDGKNYIIYGQGTLYIKELKEDLSGPLEDGLHKILVQDISETYLGYEGSHLYKHNGKYYLFTCHMLKSNDGRKTEDVFISDNIEGPYECHELINEDMHFHGLGVAQGGMVSTPDGKMYAFMFQDRGAIGRVPILMELNFHNEVPVVREVPNEITVSTGRKSYIYEPINESDDFNYEPDKAGNIKLKNCWQFNHVPVNELWSVQEKKGVFRLHSDRIVKNLTQSVNTLTQRSVGPISSAAVTVDGTNMKNGDYLAISAFESCYGAIALKREQDRYYLVMLGKPADNDSIFPDKNENIPGIEYAKMEWGSQSVRLRVVLDFTNKIDVAEFYYLEIDGKWESFGEEWKLYFKMDHFTGCRFALSYFSTEETGGVGDFSEFTYYENQKSIL